MIQYNLNLFRSLLQDLSVLTNAAVTFYENDFTSSSAHSVTPQTRICSLIKSCDQEKCRLSDQCAFNMLRDNENAIYYTCHFGFVEMAFRLYDKKTSYGYILVGPFRAAKSSKKDLTSLKNLCEATNADYNQIVQYYHKLSRFSLERFNSLQNLLFSLFDYAKSQHYIFEKNDIFNQHIEPYLKEHLHENLSINFLCKQFLLTQKQLYNIFQVNTHSTPKHYICLMRVNKARELIITTDMALPDISAAVGVEDYNYFIKIFKTYDGHTPMHYRKRNS